MANNKDIPISRTNGLELKAKSERLSRWSKGGSDKNTCTKVSKRLYDTINFRSNVRQMKLLNAEEFIHWHAWFIENAVWYDEGEVLNFFH